MQRLLVVLGTSASITTVESIVNKYIFADWEFLFFLTLIVLIDTGTGFYKHFKRGTASSEGIIQ